MNKKIAVLFVANLFLTYNAYALTQTMTASVAFISPLAISAVTQPNFGTLEGGTSATVYKLDTSAGLVLFPVQAVRWGVLPPQGA